MWRIGSMPTRHMKSEKLLPAVTAVELLNLTGGVKNATLPGVERVRSA